VSLFSAEALISRAVAVCLALALDLAFGDPPTRLHPVGWLGRFIASAEKTLRRVPGLGESAAGVVLATVTVVLAVTTAVAISLAAHAVNIVAGTLTDAVLIWLAIAARGLAEEGRAVARHLGAGDILAAQARVARVVARRTDALDASGVARAAVESMGENVVDGVIAPILWGALLGPAGAWLHKAASTLDSMVGYRNDRYRHLGTCSARLDDALAWIPARVALAVVPVAAALTGLDAAGALRVGLRDRLSHASPNAAHGEAAFAGALGVAMGGPTEYADGIHERAVIGAGMRPAAASDAASAASLVTACAIVAAGASAVALTMAALLG